MSIYSVFDISGSGLTAQRTRLDVIANNIANADTTRGNEWKTLCPPSGDLSAARRRGSVSLDIAAR